MSELGHQVERARSGYSVDFTAGRPVDEVRKGRRRKRHNVHVGKLHEIVDAIQNDLATINEVYRIAEFTSRDGAATARRSISKPPHVDDWPRLIDELYEWQLVTKITDQGSSELWAGVMRKQTGATDE